MHQEADQECRVICKSKGKDEEAEQCIIQHSERTKIPNGKFFNYIAYNTNTYGTEDSKTYEKFMKASEKWSF